jgi:hypothetical protein
MRGFRLGMHRMPSLIWLLLITCSVALVFVPVFSAAATIAGPSASACLRGAAASNRHQLPKLCVLRSSPVPLTRMRSCYATLTKVLVGMTFGYIKCGLPMVTHRTGSLVRFLAAGLWALSLIAFLCGFWQTCVGSFGYRDTGRMDRNA